MFCSRTATPVVVQSRIFASSFLLQVDLFSLSASKTTHGVNSGTKPISTNYFYAVMGNMALQLVTLGIHPLFFQYPLLTPQQSVCI
uniref:7TM_GPCR_Srx domain-containing protein n=1 Tax=Steinernema glaseri TaxID=37863 RepID=A0A1I7ZZM1_9BILA